MRAESYLNLPGSQVSLFVLMTVFLAGCPKSDPVQDAAPSTSAAASVSQVTLAPVDSVPTSVTADPTQTSAPTPTSHLTNQAPHPTGPSVSGAPVTSAQGPSPQVQVQKCCAALRKQSQQASAQQTQLQQAAVVCDTIAGAMGGATPQLDQVKALLAGVPLPPVCQGL